MDNKLCQKGRNNPVIVPEPKQHEEFENKYPVKIIDDKFGCVWFKVDRDYDIPYAFVGISLNFPKVLESAESSAKLEIFQSLLYRELDDSYCPVPFASRRSVICQFSNIEICLFELRDKIDSLFESTLNDILAFETNEKELETAKNKQLKMWDNYDLEADSLASNISEVLTLTQHWAKYDERNALISITKDSLDEFVRECLRDVYIESCYYGRLTKEEVINMDKMLKSKIHCAPVPDISIFPLRVYKMPDAVTICRIKSLKPGDDMSVVDNYYELGPFDLEASCKLYVLESFLFEKCESTLRTKGFSDGTFINLRTIAGVFAIEILVEASSKQCSISYMDEQIEVFLKNFFDEILEITEEEFKDKLNSLIDIRRPDTDIHEIIFCIFSEIKYLKRCLFDSKELEVKYLKNLTFEAFKSFVENEIKVILSKTKKLSVQIVGTPDKSLKEQSDESSSGKGDKENNSGKSAELKNKKELKEIYPEFLIDENNCNEDIYYITNIEDFKRKLTVYDQTSIEA